MQVSVVVGDHGNASTAHANDDVPCIEQLANDVELNDPLGLGRGDDSAPAPAGVLDDIPTLVFAAASRLVLAHE